MNGGEKAMGTRIYLHSDRRTLWTLDLGLRVHTGRTATYSEREASTQEYVNVTAMVQEQFRERAERLHVEKIRVARQRGIETAKRNSVQRQAWYSYVNGRRVAVRTIGGVQTYE